MKETPRPAPDPQDVGVDARTGFAWRGLLEATVFLALCLGFDQAFGNGDRFSSVDPHPFGIAVLLVAAQYGMAEAAVTALLATAALWGFNLPEQQYGQDHASWLRQVAFDPLIWFAIALVVGTISARSRRRATDALQLATRRQAELALMVEANVGLSKTITTLEGKIAGQQRTVTAVYETAGRLVADRAGMLSNVPAFVRSATNATKCSIFLLQGATLELAASTGWTEADGLRASHSGDALYDSIVGRQEMLVVNRAEDRACLKDQGLMAAPVLGADGQVFGMVKIEALPYAQLNFDTLSNFHAVCAWLGTALEHSTRFDEARAGTFLVEGGNLIAAQHADKLVSVMTDTARRIGFGLCLMQIDLEHDLDAPGAGGVRSDLVTAMNDVFRTTDLALEVPGERGRLAVLMPGCALADAQRVGGRVQEAFAAVRPDLAPALAVSCVSLSGPQGMERAA